MPSDRPLSSNNPFRRKDSSSSATSPVPAPGGLGLAIDGARPASVFVHGLGSPAVSSSTSLQGPPTAEDPFRASEAVAAPAKKKLVKKVRVQSPPPSSPEDAAAPATFGGGGAPFDDDDGDDASSSDLSGSERDALQSRYKYSSPRPRLQTAQPGRSALRRPRPDAAPPNPFEKTLEDMIPRQQRADEHEWGAVEKRGTLDVDAFRRLLLTGQASAASPTVTSVNAAPGPSIPLATAPDPASITDTSSVSRQSISDAAHAPPSSAAAAGAESSPLTSHEISDADDDEDEVDASLRPRPSSTLASAGDGQAAPTSVLPPAPQPRKKPPPPSSRHGKLIKIELGATEDASDSGSGPPSSVSNVNKPLPPPPVRSPADHELDSPFDQEAAGKVPEPREVTPSSPAPEPAAEAQEPAKKNSLPASPRPKTPSRAPSMMQQQAKEPRKPGAPAPPPPPRRHAHKVSASSASAGGTQQQDAAHQAASQLHDDEAKTPTPTRSSIDSIRSTTKLPSSAPTGSGAAAPPPPPPRRLGHAHSASRTSIAPPPVSSSSSSGSMVIVSSPMVDGTAQQSPQATIATAVAHAPARASAPPPPPPSRTASARERSGTGGSRPPSLYSLERRTSGTANGGGGSSGSHLGSSASLPPPPPPPPRHRGGSRSSSDAPGPMARRPSADSGLRVEVFPETVREGGVEEETAGRSRGVERMDGVAEEEPGAGGDDDHSQVILADLDALQREVDAYMGELKGAQLGAGR